ncbi:MAG: IS91 family transposase [Candidatus Scalindua sp.]|jgi:hypothetical protein|nr:IS91 family transposase [Bacteroidota bacterium]MBT6230548.1 IS91 family transposase [Candidatus Scalindua sp.]MBT7210756.1 IS91 family transposase [Candidatus Scalindua sp.]
MRTSKTELADILAGHKDFLMSKRNLCTVQRKAIGDIASCRTSALGGHTEQCGQCGYKRISYNSCRNRNCPKCQQSKQIVWVDKLKSSIVPVKHFQLVFTIPDILRPLFYINQSLCYTMLFKASAEALKKAMKHYHQAEGGAIAILHTWGQALNYHPHIHMIVPAGGIDVDGVQWVHTEGKFLVPIKAISKMFRGVLIHMIDKEWSKGNLIVPDRFEPNFDILKKDLYRKGWVVFAEKPIKGPGQLINYLGKYINRVAISNHRIKEWCQGKVTFSYTNNRIHTRNCKMTINDVDFINRFLWHVLPKGFYKIRYYGIYAHMNCDKREQCFELLEESPFIPSFEAIPLSEVIKRTTGIDHSYCPACKQGRMLRIGQCNMTL